MEKKIKVSFFIRYNKERSLANIHARVYHNKNVKTVISQAVPYTLTPDMFEYFEECLKDKKFPDEYINIGNSMTRATHNIENVIKYSSDWKKTRAAIKEYYKNGEKFEETYESIGKGVVGVLEKALDETEEHHGVFQPHLNKKIKRLLDTGHTQKRVRFYRRAFKVLKEYINIMGLPYDFSIFDEDFPIEFGKYMREDHYNYITGKYGLSPTSIQGYVEVYKVIAKSGVIAGEEGATSHYLGEEYRSKKYSNPDPVFLTGDEIKSVEALDMTGYSEYHKHVRDCFVLGCYTGCRYEDLVNLIPANVTFIKGNSGDRKLRYKPRKLQRQGKAPVYVTFGIIDECIPYLNKLLALGEERIVPSIIYKKVKSGLVKFNEAVKEIVKDAGITYQITTTKRRGHSTEVASKKCELISSHAMRRTCANYYYYELRLGTEMTMAVTGHHSIESFKIYLGHGNAQDMLDEIKKRRNQ